MSPRTALQNEKIRQDKRRLIMDAALELFANEGFHATSISKITKKAGISKGLMYSYFESKDALLMSIMDESIDEMMAAFDPNKDGVLTEDEFVFLVNEFFRIIVEKAQSWKLLLSLFLQPQVMELFKDKMEQWIPVIMKTAMTYFTSKGYDDPATEAMFFGTMLDGVAFDYVVAPEIYPIDNIKERILNMYTK